MSSYYIIFVVHISVIHTHKQNRTSHTIFKLFFCAFFFFNFTRIRCDRERFNSNVEQLYFECRQCIFIFLCFFCRWCVAPSSCTRILISCSIIVRINLCFCSWIRTKIFRFNWMKCARKNSNYSKHTNFTEREKTEDNTFELKKKEKERGATLIKWADSFWNWSILFINFFLWIIIIVCLCNTYMSRVMWNKCHEFLQVHATKSLTIQLLCFYTRLSLSYHTLLSPAPTVCMCAWIASVFIWCVCVCFCPSSKFCVKWNGIRANR